MDDKKIQQIKNKLEVLKAKQTENKTIKKMLMQKLKDDFQITSMEELKDHLRELKKTIIELEEEAQKRSSSLERELVKHGLL